VKTTRWALLLSALLGTVANGAEVYRSTDANGVATFTDRPNENSVPVYVAAPRAGRPGNTVAARPAAPPANANAATPGTQQAAAASGADQRVQQTPAERAAERTKNCAVARERVDKYAVSHRLYRDVGNGQREYLTDGEIDEAKARAAADVATWCD
jgi:hypothetical protein